VRGKRVRKQAREAARLRGYAAILDSSGLKERVECFGVWVVGKAFQALVRGSAPWQGWASR
jgi:hypothetical protein